MRTIVPILRTPGRTIGWTDHYLGTRVAAFANEPGRSHVERLPHGIEAVAAWFCRDCIISGWWGRKRPIHPWTTTANGPPPPSSNASSQAAGSADEPAGGSARARPLDRAFM